MARSQSQMLSRIRGPMFSPNSEVFFQQVVDFFGETL
jgi:hypothetical protein